ncbi:MAG: AAA family ATPase [Bacteroidales bacterium]|jgi:predicted kinase
MKAIITVGISGSGKTTWANQQKDYVVISRDDLRKEVLEKELGHPIPEKDLFKLWDFEKEPLINRMQFSLFTKCAKEKKNVIVADTNITKKFRDKVVEQLEQLGYTTELKVLHIDVEEAIKRDKNRPVNVGEKIIRNQYNSLKSQNLK